MSIINWIELHYTRYDDYIFPVILQNYDDSKELSKRLKAAQRRFNDSLEACKRLIPYDVKKLTTENVTNNMDILNYEFCHKSQIYAKKLFAFSHYAQGMNLIDMANLKYSRASFGFSEMRCFIFSTLDITANIPSLSQDPETFFSPAFDRLCRLRRRTWSERNSSHKKQSSGKDNSLASASLSQTEGNRIILK